MAPILKELETTVAPGNAASSGAPQGKPANETAVRPQPVALEIPVTINGARTVEGSDKRAPFSESTQTVLVFPHGAVIRIATPLVPGQLVFLTNDKTKKEVVCQVVKSKSSGGAGSYVELQFTEPSLAFWGLQVPGPSAAPAAPRPVASAPVSGKPAAPPVTAKPAVTPKAVAPRAVTTAPPPPVVPPRAAPVNAVPLVPATEVPKLESPETPKVSMIAEKPVAAPAVPRVPPATEADSPAAAPTPPPRDFSKQIDALFAVPQAPTTPLASTAPPPAPTTEDLKLQAARLQEQLSSMLFAEKPVVSEAPPARPTLYTPENAANELSAKLADIIHAGPTAVSAPSEPKSVVPIRKSAPATLGAEEEVRIPSWLAPISQHAEAATESSSLTAASADHGVPVNSEESYDALVAGSRPETVVFGGQLLGESSVSTGEGTASGSKKGLFLGLAAAGILVIGGGAWYYRQNQGAASAVTPSPSSSVTTANEPTSAPNAPAPTASSTVAGNGSPSPVAPTKAPSVSSGPSSPFSAPAVSAPPPKSAKPSQREEEEATTPAKPSLGDVRLSAPVVNRTADTQQDSDAFAAIDTKSIPSGGDPLASAAAHRGGPAAPLPVGGEVKPPELLKSVAPEYPAIAKAQHVFGRVQIDAAIDASGNVTSVKVISGPALLHRAALDAVKQWKYAPAILDGQPTTAHVTVNVDFRTK